MPHYVVKLTHTSDQCPGTNAKVRQRVLQAGPELPKLAQKLGVRFIAGPLILGSEHASLVVAEADRIEAVDDLLAQSGLLQWNAAQVSSAKPMEEALKDLEKWPPALY